jgi:hypothetical protein
LGNWSGLHALNKRWNKTSRKIYAGFATCSFVGKAVFKKCAEIVYESVKTRITPAWL